MKKLTYLEKISPYGVFMQNVGYIHSPYLKNIMRIGYTKYQYALSLFLYSPDKWFESISKEYNIKNIWFELPPPERKKLSMFDIYTATPDSREELLSALSLFIDGNMEWDEKSKSIVIDKSTDYLRTTVSGYISNENYNEVAETCIAFADVIIEKEEDEADLKFATESDRIYYERFMKIKKENRKVVKPDDKYELANIISLVCTFHPSINYTNVFDLTLNQLKDTFTQLAKSMQVNILNTNYAVWGGDKYDKTAWLERIDKN